MRGVFYGVWTIVWLLILVAAALWGVAVWLMAVELMPAAGSADLAPGATAGARGFTLTIHDIRDPLPEVWARNGERIVGFDLSITAGDKYDGGCFDFALVDGQGNEARPVGPSPEVAHLFPELRPALRRGETARGWCLFAVPAGASLRALRFEHPDVAIEFQTR